MLLFHISAHFTACFYREFVVQVFFCLLFLLLFAFVSFHFSFLVRQPYSETSCSCVLVDGSIVWTRRTIKAKKKKKKKEKWKGQPEAVNWTLFSSLKCEETLKTASQDLWDERVNIDIEYVVILLFPLASFLCFFFSLLSQGCGFPPFFFLSALHPAEEIRKPQNRSLKLWELFFILILIHLIRSVVGGKKNVTTLHKQSFSCTRNQQQLLVPLSCRKNTTYRSISCLIHILFFLQQTM